jgi:enoyl-CoA hydratase
MSDCIVTEKDSNILIVRLNRPEVRNAVDRETSEAISQTFDRLDDSGDLAVAVLTGQGGSFCAGMDLKAFARGELPYSERGFAGIARRPPRKPVLAAVEGFAVGGGFEVALACDLIVAGQDARFGLPEVKRGLTAAAGGLFRLPRRIPYHVAMECALTGNPISADRAYEVGLVNRVVPTGEALAAALQIARAIAANGPLAVVASKTVIVESQDWEQEGAFEMQEVVLGPVRSSADALEGALAFAEKRAPVWTGS